MRTFGENFTEDVKVDRFHLDEENELQPSLYAFYADKMTDAKQDRDKAADALKFITATRDIYYRRNPPDDVKTTEKVFDDLVTTDTEVVQATEELRRTEKVLNTITNALSSVDQRRSSLNNLTELYVKNYYTSKQNDFADVMNDRLNGRDK